MNWSTLASVRLFFVICLVGLLGGCAAGINHLPTVISPIALTAQRQVVTLEKTVDLKLGTGYTRTIKQGSQWERIGSVAQGDVFKSHDGIFTVEGAHVHEAYLVVNSQSLVGFYLPAERGFVPCSEKPQISLSVNPK
jgi:hypothetical protein